MPFYDYDYPVAPFAYFYWILYFWSWFLFRFLTWDGEARFLTDWEASMRAPFVYQTCQEFARQCMSKQLSSPLHYLQQLTRVPRQMFQHQPGQQLLKADQCHLLKADQRQHFLLHSSVLWPLTPKRAPLGLFAKSWAGMCCTRKTVLQSA